MSQHPLQHTVSETSSIVSQQKQKILTEIKKINNYIVNQAQIEYKHVLANISRCITRAVWTKWNGLVADNVAHAQSSRRFYRWCVRSACGVRALGLADYRWALPRISIMLLQQRIPCTDCKSAQQCTTRGHPLPLPQVTSGSVQYCRHAAVDRHTDRQTRVTTIHFSWSSTHAKCNDILQHMV